MSTTPAPALVPVQDRLPPKKRDPRQAEPEQTPATTFKVPYPYKSQHPGRSKNGVKPLHTPYLDLSPSRPAPVTTLYQPWVQSNTVTRSKPYVPYPVRDRHDWEKWRDFYHGRWAAVDSRLEIPLMSSHHMRPPREGSTSVLPLDHPRHTAKIRPVAMSTEDPQGMGLGYRLEVMGARGRLPSPPGTPKETCMRRRGKQWNQTQRITETNPAHLSSGFTSPVYDLSKLVDAKHNNTSSKYTTAPALSYQPVDQYWTLGTARDVGSPPNPSPSAQPPWLLPHFAAGSLIELRDGRLKRVEDLQTEDFQLGSEVSPQLHISSCTVQHISASSSPAFSRLIVLLHKELSQELLDVFVEYPFFVCGRGWSSCCPQRTARLCGLRCHQLSVGDICLALTPAPPPSSLPSSQGPDVPAVPAVWGQEEESESLQCTSPRPAQDLPSVSDRLGEGPEPRRKRRWSAPELSGPGSAGSDSFRTSQQ